MTSGSRTLQFARLLPLIAGTVFVAGCVDKVDTAVLSCPCATGYVCCESGVCATEQMGCAAATAALSATVAGHWTGYIENLAGGDDAVDLTIAVASDGSLSGQVTIGSGTPPAPATDGTVGWPASIDQGLDTVPPTHLSGFAYTATDMSWLAKRLKIRVPTYEPWEPWCALQQSYPTPDGYRCYPAGNFMSLGAAGNCQIDTDPTMTTDPLVAIGCTQYAMCDTVRACNCPNPPSCNCGGNGVCECDATGCHAGSTWMSVPIGSWFDLSFHGNDGDGSVALGLGGQDRYNVRLMRAPN
jgi:hypothetical protein